MLFYTWVDHRRQPAGLPHFYTHTSRRHTQPPSPQPQPPTHKSTHLTPVCNAVCSKYFDFGLTLSLSAQSIRARSIHLCIRCQEHDQESCICITCHHPGTHQMHAVHHTTTSLHQPPSTTTLTTFHHNPDHLPPQPRPPSTTTPTTAPGCSLC